MFGNPAHHDRSDEIDFCFRESSARRDSVPFRQTVAATAAGCVLGDEAGMTPHGGLASGIPGMSGSEPFLKKLPALAAKYRNSRFGDDAQLLLPQPETGTEF